MNNVIEEMVRKHNPKNTKEKENVIKEIIQEIALVGLSRGGFFDKACFYGGTCLRIFHGLDRFSEDLDFALIDKDDNFDLSKYFPYLIKEFESYGINLSVEKKEKEIQSDVQSAFLKGNTQMLFMTFFPSTEDAKNIIPNQKIKIKFEIDTDNPSGGVSETKYHLLPSPYEATVFDMPTLFAGKIHAILCRDYKYRVKGRDFYDYLFFVSRGGQINLKYLENKLKNTGGVILDNESLTLEKVRNLLKEKFENTDYEYAKNDVLMFVTDSDSIALWNKELFISTLDELKSK